jgi:SM-20-related protein
MQQKMEQLIVDVTTHGYGICDDFLTTSEVDDLLKWLNFRYENGSFKQAKVGKLDHATVAENLRGDQILWLEEDSSNDAERIILDKNLLLIDYLNVSCYLGIKHCEIHFAKYGEGKFYKRHVDTFQNQQGRVLSIIYYLNKDWQPQDGGELILYPNIDGVEETIVIAPLAGRLICFESEVLAHEVAVTHTNRYSITGWMVNR